MIHLQFLGTSAGTPTLSRNVTSLCVHFAPTNQWMLIDCGEGTQLQLQKSITNVSKLSSIFITHLHGDHIYGLPGVLASRSLFKISKPLTIVGPVGIKEYVESSLKLSYCQLGYELKFIEIDYRTQSIDVLQPLAIDVIPLKHNVESFGYRFLLKGQRHLLAEKLDRAGIEKGPVRALFKKQSMVQINDTSYRSDDFLSPPAKDTCFIVCGDNAKPDLLEPYLDGCELLVHEATYSLKDFNELDRRQMHSTAFDVAHVAQKNALTNLILTHFSPRYQGKAGLADFTHLKQEARSQFKGHLFFARDLNQYVLRTDGCVHAVS